MLTFAAGTRIFLCREPVDMRKNQDGLFAATQEILGKDPMSGHYFVFFNRRRNRVKILYWEEGGFWVFYKRLEKGTFEIPLDLAGTKNSIEVPEWRMNLIFHGITVKEFHASNRFKGYGREEKPDRGRSLQASAFP
jgi:transposase